MYEGLFITGQRTGILEYPITIFEQSQDQSDSCFIFNWFSQLNLLKLYFLLRQKLSNVLMLNINDQ